jgi:hypothetical protein
MSSSNNHSKKGTHYHVGTDDCQHLGQTSFDQLELDILQITRLFFYRSIIQNFTRGQMHTAWRKSDTVNHMGQRLLMLY